MDALHGLPSLPAATTVHERRGSQKQADAFRRALQQGGGDGGTSTEDPERAPATRTVPRGRQLPGPGEAVHHVDVIA